MFGVDIMGVQGYSMNYATRLRLHFNFTYPICINDNTLIILLIEG